MSWEPMNFDELGYISRGRSRHRPRDAAHLYGGQYPFVQTGDVKHAGLYLTEYTQTYSEEGLAQSRIWPTGTLCITIAANIADTAILGFDACFPDSVIGFIPDDKKADARFIKYLFDALLQRKYKQFTQGAAQDNLSQAKLLSLKFPIPGIIEQKQIADVISTYDDLIENNRRRIQLLEQAARLLYKEWFVHLRFPGHEHTKIIDGVPEGWEKRTYADLFEFLGGFAFKSKTYLTDGRYGVVTIKNVHNARFVPECPARLDVPPEKTKDHCLLKTGDILLSLTGNVGRACIVYGDDYLLNQRVAKVVGRSGIPASFVYWTFSNDATQRELENLAYGVAQLNLSPVKLGEREFLEPPKMILNLFAGTAAPIFSQICSLNLQNKQLAKVRDLLLPKLMNGEVAI